MTETSPGPAAPGIAPPPHAAAAPARTAAVAGPLLDITDLRVEIPTDGGQRVVRPINGVTFTLDRGQVVAIVGESGSGKSMTALAIMRLLPGAAKVTGGDIRFGGESLLAKSDADIRAIRGRRISMILQDPMISLDPLFTVGDQLAEALRIHNVARTRNEMQARMVALLSAVGIPLPEVRLRQYPHEMSGGMLQRIVGAIAISCDPELLIADEPTTSLDMTVQAQFLDLLENLQEEKNLALILVTHDFGVAARLADHVLVMYAGRVMERAPVLEIFDNPRHPYTQALLGAMPHAGEAGGRLRSIEGTPPDAANLPPGCPFAPRCPAVRDRCRTEDPPDMPIAAGHVARCWYADVM
jgi:peptide/nickel transport system ATP-binding protein/oligopeptide transport system ATP-binding protein